MPAKTKAELLDEIEKLMSRVAELQKQRDERQQAHQDLQERESRFRAMVSSALDPMICIDAQGIVLCASQSVESDLGWSADELVGQNIRVLVPEPYRSQYNDFLERRLKTGEYRIIGSPREMEAVRKDGSVYPCELTVWRVDLPGHAMPIFTGIIRDISQRKKAEETLRENREWLSTTLTSIGDGVIATDNEDRVTFINPVAQRLTGWGDEAIDLPIHQVFEIVNERTRQSVDNPVEQVLRDGKTVGLANHTILISKNGQEFNIADCGAPIRNLAGEVNGAVLVFRDVTEIQKAEAQSRLHQEELAHVMRLSTMGEMAAGMAHELNQPLSAIAAFSEGSAEMLRSGTGQTEELISISTRISEQAQRAGEIIRRLRQFIKKREPQRTNILLNDAVREVAAMIAAEAHTFDIRIDLQLVEPSPWVTADLIQIEQVVLNLARNAFEAMQSVDPEHRMLTLRTALTQRNTAEVAVIDSGEGLEDELLDRVFEPFFTTKDHGMGIGLAISRSIVELHGGQLSVNPNDQRGLTFRFELPTAEKHEIG